MDVYVVVENGEPYLKLFRTYSEAISAVKERHAEALEEDLILSKELECPLINTVDSPEAEGTTYLYIEKGINIYVYRLSW